jgi:hypothetical protein
MSDQETWRAIPGWPAYEVSDQGRVRSYYRFDRGRYDLAAIPQRFVRSRKGHGGYPILGLYNHARQWTVRLHKLVMLAFIGPCPDGMEVCHNDGNPQNNRLDNLRYDTHAGNCADPKKRTARIHGPHLFTPHQVEAIRLARAAGASYHRLGREYGCCPGTIWYICNGRSYPRAPGPIVKNGVRFASNVT